MKISLDVRKQWKRAVFFTVIILLLVPMQIKIASLLRGAFFYLAILLSSLWIQMFLIRWSKPYFSCRLDIAVDPNQLYLDDDQGKSVTIPLSNCKTISLGKRYYLGEPYILLVIVQHQGKTHRIVTMPTKKSIHAHPLSQVITYIRDHSPYFRSDEGELFWELKHF